MIDWIINLYTESPIVPFFFWGPAIFNGLVYPVHIWARVQKDRKAVENNQRFYSDFITIGTIVKYIFLTFLPVLNALSTVFHAAPIAWIYLAHRLEWLFDIQLVKDTRAKD